MSEENGQKLVTDVKVLPKKRGVARTAHTDRTASPAKEINGLVSAANSTLSDPLLKPFALRAMFMRPVYLEKSAWLEHIPFAFWLVAAQQPKILVELGTHYGSSYFAFCQAVERLGQDTRCFAVDTWKGDEHAGFYGNEVFEKVRAHNDAHYSDFSRLIKSTFDDAVGHFSDGTIDLLHIDGLHTLEAVRHDFERWLPKLSDRAIVLFHDSNVRERQFGVFKLIEQLGEIYPCFEFAHGHGLAVLAVGTKQNDLLRGLLKADKDEFERRAVHELFGRLGRACSDAYAVQAEQLRARELEAAIVKHKTDFENTRGALEKTKGELNVRVREINDLQTKLQAEVELRAMERGQLGERASLFQSLRDELKEDAGRLNARVDRTVADLKERTDTLLSLQGVMRETERQLAEVRRQTDMDKTALASAREELEKSQKSLDATRADLDAERQATVDLRECLQSVAAAHAAAEKNLSDERKATAAARDKLRSESEARAAVEKTADDRRIEAEKLATQLRAAGAEREKLEGDLAEVQRRLNAVAVDLAAEREAIATARDKHRSESEARAGAEKTADDRRIEAEKLATQLRAAGAEREKLEGDVAEGQRRLNAVAVELAAEREAIATARDKLRSESEARAEAEKTAEDRRIEAEKLGSEVRALHSKLKERFDETARLTELYLAEKATAQRLRKQIETMEAEREAELDRLSRQHRLELDNYVAHVRAAIARLMGRALAGMLGYTKESRPKGRELKALANKIQAIGLFDAEWYLRQHEDVAKAAVDPAVHYIEWGVFEGREPFDIIGYLEK